MSSQFTEASSVTEKSSLAAAQLPQALRRRNTIETWAFLIPGILFQLTWGWFPLVMSFILSFTDGKLIRSDQFVGFDNYRHLLTDTLVSDTYYNTLVYSGLGLVLTFALPIIVAIFIMEMPKKIVYLMMFLWFLPLSGITSLILTKYFYDPHYGLYQYIFVNLLHLPPQKFLSDPHLVMFWIVFPSVLFFGPGLLYMATLQGIPTSYFEASEVEGAGFWRKIWTITLPRLRPIIYLSLLFAIVGALQPFDAPQILTGGNPPESRTSMMYVFDLIKQFRFSDAAALSTLTFVISMGLAALFRLVFKDDPDA
ncbi:carbohydrate ABC transporter permease [Tengunoibacter tsumagoiensis]|uniref:Sugar ABC transporter permease n=1 Tax=Tengunoibacter tsumagoiensis TaxID=2014871 RepID=A0A401ZZ24_9CHLR|nr:sugar ABC transporter permease [Tengunoibacter tsumagoiensis]GCE12072.1 sugar ABC transporter permease [Tengunoibacter tsumagoiensis]